MASTPLSMYTVGPRRIPVRAQMAELADAGDSKSPDLTVLWVRPPLWAFTRAAAPSGSALRRGPAALATRTWRPGRLPIVWCAQSPPLQLLQPAAQLVLQREVAGPLDG